MNLKFRDEHGVHLHVGDIVENLEKRVIARVTIDGSGRPVLRMEKKFNFRSMQYEPVAWFAPNEAIDMPLAPRKTKWYWRRNGWRIPDLQVLYKAPLEHQNRRNTYRTVRHSGKVLIDAPVPWA